MLLTEMAIDCVNRKNDEFYSLFENKLSNFIGLKCLENGVFSEVKISYSYLFQYLITNAQQKAFSFLEIVMKHRVKCAEDSILVEFKLACIEQAVEIIKGDVEKQDKLLDYHIDAVIEATSLK